MRQSDVVAVLTTERAYVAMLYGRLDDERTGTRLQMERVLRSTMTPGEREVAHRHLTGRVQALTAANSGLCFGRIDTVEGEALHIGRIGLHDTDVDETLLQDWRAPASRPFYCATAVRPEGVRRRRHLRTRGRAVLRCDDDVFGDGADATGADTALLAALTAPREGSMRDIVATIQADQDEIIRLGDTGVVVVEGGPGTGKTAVALHRVAHLLYTHRERLARRGVLVVGPNAGFLDHVGTVLPSLGETSVVFATPASLFPGVRASGEETPHAARLKGGLDMIDVLDAAVADRQELPGEPIRIDRHDTDVVVDADVAERARAAARATGRTHNVARAAFRAALIAELTEQFVSRTESGLREGEEVWDAPWKAGDGDPGAVDRELRAALRADTAATLDESPAVDDVVERLWPALGPRQLLAELFSSPARIAAATPGWSDVDRAALYRGDGAGWTAADAPLLDEAVELLGPDPEAQRRRELVERAEQGELEWAEGVLEVLDPDGVLDPDDPDREYLIASDVLDATDLARRHADRDARMLAERAVLDREWTYGHVVVDEAQELSPMDWRVLMRRCPSRSMTVVGDLAQRQAAAGAPSWGAVLDPYVPGRFVHRSLTVNYRTPAEVMDVAARVLAEVDPGLTAPYSVRASSVAPWARATTAEDLGATAAAVVHELALELAAAPTDPDDPTDPAGTAVVVVPDGMELTTGVPGATVVTPRGAKGLEFDRVVVVEPGRMSGPELYVALTRATQRLAVVHATPLPPALASLPSG